eukprot:snap_masked-scaffold_2-processed-gene-21.5-mRNA-1 protein AED:0.99 eAED:1.00 QI:0/-1/0/1/-1/1/1/0/192
MRNNQLRLFGGIRRLSTEITNRKTAAIKELKLKLQENPLTEAETTNENLISFFSEHLRKMLYKSPRVELSNEAAQNITAKVTNTLNGLKYSVTSQRRAYAFWDEMTVREEDIVQGSRDVQVNLLINEYELKKTLSPDDFLKFRELAGPRYNAKRKVLKLTEKSFPKSSLNRAYIQAVLANLIYASKNNTPLF